MDRVRNEILHMQVRLFRLACKMWNKNEKECSDLFDTYEIDKYIRESYEIFHVQGDEANLEEIELYLQRKGVQI